LTHPAAQMDTDGDKVSDAMETYMGTDATKPCPQTFATTDETPLDNWPVDIGNDNGFANTLDLTGYADGLNHYVGEIPAALARLDQNNDGMLTTLDMATFSIVFHRSCGSLFAEPVPPPDGPIPGWSQQ
jgi:hypothetical protein